jgi:selenocysteine lyase/cysteine desulfurase
MGGMASSGPHTAALGSRKLFPDLEGVAYFNHAAVSPPSLPVRAAAAAALDDYARLGAAAFPKYRDQRDALRADLARLIGANASDIALTSNTSHGVLAIALGFPWRHGDRVVLFRGEFPANVTPWQRAAELIGLEIVMLDIADFAPDIGRGLAALEATLRKGARLVAVSAVQFQSGLRMPLREMAALCHEHGAELFVDAIQAIGALPFDAPALGADYVAAGSHKWLMGIEGAGMLWIHPRRIGALRPVLASWLSHTEPVRFLFEGEGLLRYDRPIRARADFLEMGVMGSVNFAALHAAVRILLQLGPDAICAHVSGILDRLEHGLLELGFTSLRARAPERRSGILGVRPPEGAELVTLWRRLSERGVHCALPDGVLRFAPHWPNDLDQADAVLAIVREAL